MKNESLIDNLVNQYGSEQFTVKAVLYDCSIRAAKNGSPYLGAKMYVDGVTGGCSWFYDQSEQQMIDVLSKRKHVLANVTAFVKNGKYINLKEVEPLSYDLDEIRKEMRDSIESDVLSNLDKIRDLINRIEDQKIHKLCTLVFEDESFMNHFLIAPAAIYKHHCQNGGLVLHTLEVMEMSYNVAVTWEDPSLDIDVVIAGAFFHDTAKVESYIPQDNVVDYGIGSYEDMIGHLVGSVFIMASYLFSDDELRSAYKSDVEFRKKIFKMMHVILASHGKKEWDAVKEPLLPEAFLVSVSDNFSAKRIDEVEIDEYTG